MVDLFYSFANMPSTFSKEKLIPNHQTVIIANQH